MRSIDQIRNEILIVLEENSEMTDREIGIELNISPRLLMKILDDMVAEGILDETDPANPEI